jgi:hypothetical protein
MKNGGLSRESRGQKKFSTVWKTFFHSMENGWRNFPWHGKNGLDFSTLWKTFFHGMEKPGGGE